MADQTARPHSEPTPLALWRPSQPSPRPRVPVPPTSLLGREEIVAALLAMLGDERVRLLTLTGPGGVGKTRLALRVAADVPAAYADRVTFVSLAAVTCPDLVLPAIAREFGPRDFGEGCLADRLRLALQGRPTLLVLDNFEHVLAAAIPLARLLESVAGLTVLATSRIRLRLSGEHVVPIPPLGLPDLAILDTTDREPAPSARLFVERARASKPGFALTPDNAADIAALCHRLDGLPLAIELAAAWVAVLPPATLLARLNRRLPWLINGPRDLPDRLRTMEATIAWSYDLLPAAERLLFRQLSVFVGGFTLEAAQAVAVAVAATLTRGCQGSDEADPSPRDAAVADTMVLSLLASLIDHSLIRLESGHGGEPRYLILETIREFGRERLDAMGELEAALDAHAAYFGGFDERLDPNHHEPFERVDDRLLRTEAEHPNLRAALARLAETGDAAGVLRLAGALAVFWHHRGYLREGRHWLEWALARTPEQPTIARGRALSGLSLVVWTQGDHEVAAPLANAGLAIAKSTGDRELAALSLHLLGLIDNVRERWESAEALMAEALDLWREITLPTNEAMALQVLSGIAFRRGDANAATSRAEQALSIFRAQGHASGAAMSVNRLAHIALGRGDGVKAARLFAEAFEQWLSIGERWSIVKSLLGLAEIGSHRQRWEPTATLLGAIDGNLREIDSHLFPTERAHFDQIAICAGAALGEERFATLFAVGRTLRLDQGVAIAVGLAGVDSGSGNGGPSRPCSRDRILSKREMEVIRLIADGQTDQQIADVLFLSRRTVNTHVGRILTKLGASSRQAATVRAYAAGVAASTEQLIEVS